jgi:hypothetical protein
MVKDLGAFTSSSPPSSWWFSNNLVLGHHVWLIVVNRLSLLSSWSFDNLVIGHHPRFISINLCILVVLFLVVMFISLLKVPCHCHPFNDLLMVLLLIIMFISLLLASTIIIILMGFCWSIFGRHVYFIIVGSHHHHHHHYDFSNDLVLDCHVWLIAWHTPKSLVEPTRGSNYVELRKVGTWGPLPTSSTKRG